jgi:plasmid maintenance system antidote protein VapI
LLKEKSIDPTEFAIGIGVDRPSFNKLLQGNGHIDASLSTYLVGALEQDEIPEYWLFMQRDYDNWKKTHP